MHLLDFETRINIYGRMDIIMLSCGKVVTPAPGISVKIIGRDSTCQIYL
jgi:hypothetical protein